MIKPIYIIGDIHARFRDLKNLIVKTDISDCYLICVGDLGIGFNYTAHGERMGCSLMNEFFAERKIVFMSIRGNHDDPLFFNGPDRIDFPNFKLLPDYHIEFLNDQKFLFVGGAVSIDRTVRKEGKSWWRDEKFELKPNLIVKCDVVITHSAPSWLGPFDKEGIKGWCERDQRLWSICVKERDDIDKMVKLAKPHHLYCGHFHDNYSNEYDNCRGRILAELEIIEHR